MSNETNKRLNTIRSKWNRKLFPTMTTIITTLTNVDIKGTKETAKIKSMTDEKIEQWNENVPRMYFKRKVTVMVSMLAF